MKVMMNVKTSSKWILAAVVILFSFQAMAKEMTKQEACAIAAGKAKANLLFFSSDSCNLAALNSNVTAERILKCGDVTHSSSNFNDCLDAAKNPNVRTDRIQICGEDTTLSKSFKLCLEAAELDSVGNDDLTHCNQIAHVYNRYESCLYDLINRAGGSTGTSNGAR